MNTLRNLATFLITLAMSLWAVSLGTAHSFVGQNGAEWPQKSRQTGSNGSPVTPGPVTFRDVRGRGLLVKTWVNGAGPFNFAIDTGAGITLLSTGVADEAKVTWKRGRAASVAGLSGVTTGAREALIQSIAIGDRENYLPGKGPVIVTSGLPPEVDGVLDPTEAFAPFGYVLDIPGRKLMALDPQRTPLRLDDPPADGTVVRWLREGSSRKPFVLLDTGQRALLDTGSSLGLAVTDRNYHKVGPGNGDQLVRDVGGGSVSTRRVAPTTVAVGALTLRNIPTDLVSGEEAGAPVLLGLSALRPFRLRFDPTHRLIEIAPASSQR